MTQLIHGTPDMNQGRQRANPDFLLAVQQAGLITRNGVPAFVFAIRAVFGPTQAVLFFASDDPQWANITDMRALRPLVPRRFGTPRDVALVLTLTPAN